MCRVFATDVRLGSCIKSKLTQLEKFQSYVSMVTLKGLVGTGDEPTLWVE